MANIGNMILERLNGGAPTLSPAASLYAKDKEEKKKNRGGLLGGLGYVGEKLGLGLLQGIEGVWDYAAGGIADLFGADAWAERQFSSDWLNYNHADDWYNPGEGWKVAGDVTGGIGTSLPGILTAAGITLATGGSGAAAGVGLAVGSLSAAGTSTKEAMQESGELTGKEYLYGAGMGAVEAVTEKLSGGLGAGVTKAAKSVGKAFGKVAAKETAEAAAKTAAKKGVALSLKTAAKSARKEFISEAFEEGFSEWVSPYIARATYDPNAQSATAEEILYSAFIGGLSGVGTAGAVGAFTQLKNVSSGNEIVNEGRAKQILDLAKRYTEEGFSNTEDAQGIREIYEKLAPAVERGEALNKEQRRMLGELNSFEMAEQLRPTLQRSALTAVQSADAIAARLNADGRYKMVDDKFTYVDSEQSVPEGATVRDITAEDITKGYDPSKKNSIKEAVKSNDVLRFIAASDAAGRFIMTAKDFEKAALSGQKIQSQADLNYFIENASAEQKAAVGKELGVTDWNTLNIEGFNERAAAYRESGKAEAYKQKTAKIEKMKQLADSKPKSIPRAIALSDGDVKHYADADSNIAIARTGDTFLVYDYKTGNVTRDMTRAEVNAELARYRQSKSATTETTNATTEKTSENFSSDAEIEIKDKKISKTAFENEFSEEKSRPTVKEIKAANEAKEQAKRFDALAKEKIKDYDGLSEANKSMIRKIFREAEANGISEADALSYARVSARTGLDIVFDKKACYKGKNEAGAEVYHAGFYDPENNRIVVNPETKKKHTVLLIHELSHAMRSYRKNGEVKYFIDKDAKVSEKMWKEIRKYYADENGKVDEGLALDEASAYYAEAIFGTEGAIDLLLGEKPTLKQKILSFFTKSAAYYSTDEKLSKEARRHFRKFKAMFDAFTARNYGRNAETGLTGDTKARRFAAENTQKITADMTAEELQKVIDTKRTEVVNEIVGKSARRFSMEVDNSVNEQYNKNKTLSIKEIKNDQGNQNSGVLEGRVLSAVNESKNIQRQRGDDSRNTKRGMAFDRDSGRYSTGSNSYREDVSGYLARTDVVSPNHYKRYQESVLRGLEGKLAGRDSSGRSIPEEIREKYKNTVLKNEKGELLSVFHWTNNIFKVFEYGDIGFHFGTYKAALDRRTSKSYEVGADRVKEVYLNVKKPIFLEDLGYWDCSAIASQLWEKGLISYDDLVKLQRTKGYVDGVYSDDASKEIRKILGRLGYDGILYQNAAEDKGTLSVIALYPEQIYTVSESTVEKSDSRRSSSETIENVGKSRFDEPDVKLKEKIKAGFVSAKDKLYIEVVDELYGVEKYLTKFGGRNDAESFVQQVRASETIAQTMIGVAQYDITNDKGKRLGDGLTKIFKKYKVRGISDDFDDYLLHQLNVDRMTLNERSLAWKEELRLEYEKAQKAYDKAKKLVEEKKKKSVPRKIGTALTAARNAYESFEVLENKPVFGENEKRAKAITAEESRKIIAEYEKEHPEFKDSAEEVWAYSKNLQAMRVSSGLISQESADIMAKYYPHYVPSFRDKTKSVGAGTVKNASQLAVNSTIKKAKGGGEDIYSVEESLAAQTRQTVKAMQINRMANAVYEAAISSGDTSYVMTKEAEKQMKNTDPDADDVIDLVAKNNQIVFFRDGKKMEMNVAQEIFDGFKGVTGGSVPDSLAVRMSSKVLGGFKNLVTQLSPAFAVRNFVRDLQDALINTKHPRKFIKQLKGALSDMATNGNEWQLYLAYGGFASTVFDAKGFTHGVGERGFEAFRQISGIDESSFKKIGKGLKNVLTVVGNANAFIEQLTRFMEFKASLAAGDSIQTAINNSAEVTTNFSRHGKVVKVLNATFIPFLNASVQGFDKLLRVISGPFKEQSLAAIAILFAKILAIGIAPQILNMLMYGDEEDYEDLTNEVRENYFLIKAGDQYIKIPRGRAAGAFGGIANRIGNVTRGDSFDLPGYLESLKNNVTPLDSFTRDIFSPFRDVATNTTWYGGEIEGRQFENVRPSQRYDESTSSIAVALGGAFNYSPKKIHYLLDQYSGVIGDFLLPVTTKKAEKDYLSANFLIDPKTNNKLSDEFYKLYDDAQFAKNDGDETAYYQLRHLNDVKDSVSKLYDEIESIQKSNKKNSDKLNEVRTIRALINNLYKTAKTDYAAYTKAIEATAGLFDETTESGKRLRHTVITKMMYGSEKALEEYNSDVYEKSQLFNKAGMSYDTFYEYYFTTKFIEPDTDRRGEKIEGSKRKNTIAAINNLNATREEKLLMIVSSGYALKDGDIRGLTAANAKRMLLRYILSMKGTQAEKAALAKACGFEVKNGKILKNSL